LGDPAACRAGGREFAVVLIDSAKAALKDFDTRVTGARDYRLDRMYVTDRTRRHEQHASARSRWR
jgi:hypothetical protein